MMNEEPFRIGTIILFGSLFAMGFYHRLRAHNSRERISRNEEGFARMVLLRLFGFSVWIGLILYMINPRFMAWSSYPLSPVARWLGAVIILCVLPFIFWMFRSLGKNITDTVVIRKNHTLVTTGPYRWVRHPMYLLTIGTVCGFSLLVANWFIAVMGCMTFLFIFMRTPIEEKKLIEQFGDEYRDYMNKTGKYFPHIFRI